MKIIWVTTVLTFKKGKKKIKCVSTTKKGTIDWGTSDAIFKATMAGWKLVKEEFKEEVSFNYLPKLRLLA